MWGSRTRPEPGHRRRPLRILALVALLLPSSALAQATPLRDELAKSVGLTQAQLQSMGRDPIAREIPVPDRSRGIAFVALIRLQTDGSAPLSDGHLADTAARVRGAGLMGSFHDPARPEDVASLRFPDDDTSQFWRTARSQSASSS